MMYAELTTAIPSSSKHLWSVTQKVQKGVSNRKIIFSLENTSLGSYFKNKQTNKQKKTQIKQSFG